jgi:hypothetical protein
LGTSTGTVLTNEEWAKKIFAPPLLKCDYLRNLTPHGKVQKVLLQTETEQAGPGKKARTDARSRRFQATRRT